MKTPPPFSVRSLRSGFTVVELVVAFLLFSVATASVLMMSTAMTGHRTAATSASQRNAYATFQSEIALQGINPAAVGNPLGGAINQVAVVGTAVSLGSNTTLTVTRDRVAAFETGAVSRQGNLARSALGGSAAVDAINYTVAVAGAQATRGAGIGFAVETSGPQAALNATPLAPPTFNVTGDLTNATFPLSNIATLPSNNPPGTVYRYTTDGSTPTATSLIWDNNPGWTNTEFPAEVTLAAFNTDPQYATSSAVTATYSMQLAVTYGRADGRTSNTDGFTLADISDPTDTGVVLTLNVPGISILYTLDGSNPASDGVAYSGPFSPVQGNFSATAGNSDLTGSSTGTATLEYVALSSDSRYLSTQVVGQTLSSIAVPLTAPVFVTSNATPLSPGTPVVISMSGSTGTPRTAVNSGVPTTSSSSATSFPLN